MGVPPEPIPPFDLYAELEVAPTASSETIDAAWRSLVKRHHPDAARPEQAAGDAERIRRLNIAHHWLADPARRARYDSERVLGGLGSWSATPPPPSSHAPTDEEPDWSEIRREAGRAGADRRRRPATLLSSPILGLAVGLIGLLVVLLAVAAVPQLAGIGRQVPTPTPQPVPTEAPLTPSSVPTPTPTLSAAEEFAGTIPDRVAGIQLAGEHASGVEVFGGDRASLDQFLASAGGREADLVGAYKGGQTPDGEPLTIIGLQLVGADGRRVASAFQEATATDPAAPTTWTDETVDGRSVSVSVDPSDPRFSAYLIGAADAMYLVISSDPDLATAAIRALPA